jgi:hypothetical protein
MSTYSTLLLPPTCGKCWCEKYSHIEFPFTSSLSPVPSMYVSPSPPPPSVVCSTKRRLDRETTQLIIGDLRRNICWNCTLSVKVPCWIYSKFNSIFKLIKRTQFILQVGLRAEQLLAVQEVFCDKGRNREEKELERGRIPLSVKTIG